MMKHTLFLLDLDDTLLDFRASEKLSFEQTMRKMGLDADLENIFREYQAINVKLWRSFETGAISKDFLKVERFRQTFALHHLDIDPDLASHHYLESLPETVVLIEGAQHLCETLSHAGEIGIITNGVESIQSRRVESSGLSRYVSFISTSEECGFAKPDIRFFEHTTRKATAFRKETTIIIGDRLDADILGANRFGIESCWFNPGGLKNESGARPTFEVSGLDQIMTCLDASNGFGA